MAHRDPYVILGVGRNASADDVKRAYRRLAKEHHPDRNPGNKQAEQRFKEIQAAYEILGDAERRAQYDRFGEGGPAPDFRTWSHRHPGGEEIRFDFGSMEDLTSLFEEFFSRGRASPASWRRDDANGRGRGADVEHSIELSFEEAARGAAREIVAGGGRAGRERIRVKIPSGVAEGQKIRVAGMGATGRGGRGDLYIRCRIRPHSYFRRDGLDILLDVPMTFAEAAGGAAVEIPTLDGPTVVHVPAGTSSGMKLRLRGKGIRDERAGATGDLYAVVKIMAPKRMSERAAELLRELDHELAQRPRDGWPG